VSASSLCIQKERVVGGEAEDLLHSRLMVVNLQKGVVMAVIHARQK
jgi:hypothetical protein